MAAGSRARPSPDVLAKNPAEHPPPCFVEDRRRSARTTCTTWLRPTACCATIPATPSPQGRRRNLADVAGAARPFARAFASKDHTIPTTPDGQTSSGLLAGKIRIEPEGGVTLKPYFELLPQDYLRVGVEDERWHATLPVTRRIPKGGSLALRLPRHKTPKRGHARISY